MSEQQFAEGKYQDFDEAMAELDEEFAEEEKTCEVAEAVWVVWEDAWGTNPQARNKIQAIFCKN